MLKIVARALLLIIGINEINAQKLNTMDTITTATNSLMADGATLQLISNQFSFTEGPAADKAGNVFFYRPAK